MADSTRSVFRSPHPLPTLCRSRRCAILPRLESGRALCHCFSGRFDSAVFCPFGGC